MTLASPQTITIGGVAKSLIAVQADSGGLYKTADGIYTLSIKHDLKTRYSHLAQLKMSDLVANPLVPSSNIASEAWVNLVINQPRNGLSNAQVIALANGLRDWAIPAIISSLTIGEV